MRLGRQQQADALKNRNEGKGGNAGLTSGRSRASQAGKGEEEGRADSGVGLKKRKKGYFSNSKSFSYLVFKANSNVN